MNAEVIERSSKTFSAWVPLVALAAGIAAGAGVMYLRPSTTVAAPPTEEAKPHDEAQGVIEVAEEAQKNGGVTVETLALVDLPTELQVTGTVTPEESRVAHVRPLARGVIEQISVSLGARVTKGQALLTYDNIEMGQLVGEYLSAKAAQGQAEADLDVRRRGLERAEALIKVEAVAQQTLELRRAEARNAEAAVTSQRASVTRIEEQLHRFGLSDADLSRLTPQEGTSAHRSASHATLRAPASGVVTKFEVAAGELVEPDRELLTISDLSTVWVLADVYEKDLGRVRTGVDARIRVDTYPDKVFSGKLTYISESMDPQTRTAKVRCVVPNADGSLKVDMFARVSIPTTERKQTLAVPESAVQRVDNQPIVFVRQSTTTFARRDVQLGPSSGGKVEVLSGLKAGETVVTGGSFYLKTALLRELIGDEH